MIPPTGPFPRAQRIRRSREFQELSRRGERRQGASFVVLRAPTVRSGVPGRLGVTVSRRVGNAVVRNRVKRRIRDWWRRAGRVGGGAGCDLVVIARPPAARLGGAEVDAELSHLVDAS